MHNLSASPKNRLQGISFAIPELLLVTAWAEFQKMRMTIELDWHVDGMDFEEVVTLHGATHRGPPWLIWRTCDSVVVQPMAGKPRCYETVSDALEAICPEQAAGPAAA